MINEFLPISGFWLNIVGEYLFDHDLYDEAIDCFEMAIARFKEYPSEAVQNIISTDFKKIFEMEPIIFETYRSLIASHHFRDNTMKALDLSKLIYNQINDAKISKFGSFMSKTILCIYPHFIGRLQESRQIDKANKLLEKLKLIYCKSDDKLIIAQMHLQIGNDSKAKELIQTIIKDSPASITRLCAPENSVNYVKSKNQDHVISSYIEKTKECLDDNIYYFELIIGDIYFFERINSIGLQLFSIMNRYFEDLVKYINNGPDGIDKVKDLSNQFKNISSQFNDLFQSEPSICDIYYRFSFLYFVTHKEYSTNSNVDYLDQSKYYFDLAARITRRTHVKASLFNKKLKRFGNISCHEIENIFLFDQCLTTQPKIDYLLAIFSLKNQNNLSKIILLNYLGLTYHDLGSSYWVKYKLGFENKQYADLALLNLRNSIKYFNLQLKYEREEKNSPNEIQTREINGAKIKVTNSYQLVSLLRWKLKLMKECSICWDELLKSSLYEWQIINVIHWKIMIDSIVYQITEISNEILNSSSDNNQLECESQDVVNKVISRIKLNITNGIYSFKTSDQLDKALIFLTDKILSEFIDSYVYSYFIKQFNIYVIVENTMKNWIYLGGLPWPNTKVKMNENLNARPRN